MFSEIPSKTSRPISTAHRNGVNEFAQSSELHRYLKDEREIHSANHHAKPSLLAAMLHLLGVLGR